MRSAYLREKSKTRYELDYNPDSYLHIVFRGGMEEEQTIIFNKQVEYERPGERRLTKLNDHIPPTYEMIPGFKPFTITLNCVGYYRRCQTYFNQ